MDMYVSTYMCMCVFSVRPHTYVHVCASYIHGCEDAVELLC